MALINTKTLHKNSDKLGALSSTICAIHCIATPFLFVAKSCSVASCSQTPTWWKAVDVLFLIISFIAIYFSAKNSNNSLIKIGLWISWFFLALVITNEFLNIIHLPHWLIYIPAGSLIFLHIYNLKYCQCNNDKCCVHSLNNEK